MLSNVMRGKEPGIVQAIDDIHKDTIIVLDEDIICGAAKRFIAFEEEISLDNPDDIWFVHFKVRYQNVVGENANTP
jgi:hypothetical protein